MIGLYQQLTRQLGISLATLQQLSSEMRLDDLYSFVMRGDLTVVEGKIKWLNEAARDAYTASRSLN